MKSEQIPTFLQTKMLIQNEMKHTKNYFLKHSCYMQP